MKSLVMSVEELKKLREEKKISQELFDELSKIISSGLWSEKNWFVLDIGLDSKSKKVFRGLISSSQEMLPTNPDYFLLSPNIPRGFVNEKFATILSILQSICVLINEEKIGFTLHLRFEGDLLSIETLCQASDTSIKNDT